MFSGPGRGYVKVLLPISGGQLNQDLNVVLDAVLVMISQNEHCVLLPIFCIPLYE